MYIFYDLCEYDDKRFFARIKILFYMPQIEHIHLNCLCIKEKKGIIMEWLEHMFILNKKKKSYTNGLHARKKQIYKVFVRLLLYFVLCILTDIQRKLEKKC